MPLPSRSFRFLALASVVAVSGSFSHAHAQVIYRHTSMPAVPAQPVIPAMPPVAQPGTIQIVHHDAAPPAAPAPIQSVSEPSAVYPSGGGDDEAAIPADRFGHDVPFSLAVMSILPAGYTAQYDSSVDQNKLVNWAGGRPWRDVMDTLSAAHGYDVRYSGKSVIVSTSAAHQAPQAAPQAAPQVVPAVAQSVPLASDALHVHHVEPAAPAPIAPVAAQQSIPANPEPTAVGVEPVQQSVTAHDLGLKVVGGSVQGVAVNSRHFNDGGLVASDTLSGERPRLSYAPKGGGYGVYYGAAGQDVDQVIRVWAAANGWNVVDDTNMSYKLDVPVALRGDFKSSVRAILGSLAVNPKPQHMFLNGGSTVHLYLQEDQSEEAPSGNALKMHMGRHPS